MTNVLVKKSAWGDERNNATTQAWNPHSGVGQPEEFTEENEPLPSPPTSPVPSPEKTSPLKAQVAENNRFSPTESQTQQELNTSGTSVTSIQLPDEDSQYSALNFWNEILAHAFAIPMRNKRRFLKRYKKCITGKEFVSSVHIFVKKSGNPKFAKASRDQAYKICQRMASMGHVDPVAGKDDIFEDSANRFYRIIQYP